MNVHVVTVVILKETAAVLFLHLALPALAESASIDRSPRQDSNVPQTLARAGQKATSNQHHHQTISKTSGWKEMGLDGSGIEGGGERRQNERLNLISSLLKMSHRTADYWTTSRTLDSYNGYKYQNYREIEQRDYGGVPRMMKSNDHEHTWWWDEPAQMEGESRRGECHFLREMQGGRYMIAQVGGWKRQGVEGGGWPVCWHHLPASPLAAMVAVGWWGGWEADWHALAVGWRCDAPPQGRGSAARNVPPALSLRPGCWRLSEHHNPPCSVSVAVLQIFQVKKGGKRRGRKRGHQVI